MDNVVLDYGDTDADGVRRIGEPIDGTAFFPGGHGLWRGILPHGPLPEQFPHRPIMFVGHKLRQGSRPSEFGYARYRDNQRAYLAQTARIYCFRGGDAGTVLLHQRPHGATATGRSGTAKD